MSNTTIEIESPEAERSSEQVSLNCATCGQVLVETTISDLIELRSQGNLSDVALPYYLHINKTQHTGLNSNNSAVQIDDFTNAVSDGMIGIKLNI